MTKIKMTKRVKLEESFLTPNFIGSWVMETFICDQIIAYYEKNKENNVNDALLSVSVAGAAGLFVATDVSLANNFLAGYFGITDNMSNLAGVGTAGLSTACGFTAIQMMQNTFLKKNWID